MHLAAGLVQPGDHPVVQATRSMFAPIATLAQIAPPHAHADWARSCISFNVSVVDALPNLLSSVEVVALSSRWQHLLDARELVDHGKVTNGSFDLVVRELEATISKIRAHGKRVVIVGPPPSTPFDLSRCNERLTTGKWSFGGDQNCEATFSAHRERSAEVRKLLDAISTRANVEIIDLAAVLCEPATNRCANRIGDTILYRDAAHLSREGSIWLGNQMALAAQIWGRAR